MADTKDTTPQTGDAPEMAGVVQRNIKELLKLKQNEEKEKSRDEHFADKITSFTGRLAFVYIHLVLIALYILWNAGWIGLKPVDPSFAALGTVASVEAIFLSTFVLIKQTRMNKLADKRANLDLQISLLAEHEITRLLTLVSAIGHKLEIKEAQNPEYDELAREVTPGKVLDTIDKQKQDSIKNGELDD